MSEPRITRRTLLASAAAAMALRLRGGAAGEAARECAALRSLARAVGYLWNRQHDDGSWRSVNYGVLRSGQAMTPMVLHAILGTPVRFKIAGEHAQGIQPALEFMRRQVDADGALGHADPDVLEYPVYATAYAVRCFAAVGAGEDKPLLERMINYIRSAQFDERNGFKPEMPAHGGWGFDLAPKSGESGHMDLAHTRRALEAIAVADDSSSLRDARRRAQRFLALVQKDSHSSARQPVAAEAAASDRLPPFDGGFYFSPVVLAANKGRIEEEPAPHWRSYATATCDGILALLAAGVPLGDARVTAAVDWLKRHSNVDYPQGVPTDYPEPWGEAIRFYHYSVRAEVYHKLNFPAEERARLAAAIMKHQRPDGSFVNTASPLMKEDDPILCTALVVVALTNCLP